jgi:hypothetical protein
MHVILIDCWINHLYSGILYKSETGHFIGCPYDLHVLVDRLATAMQEKLSI